MEKLVGGGRQWNWVGVGRKTMQWSSNPRVHGKRTPIRKLGVGSGDGGGVVFGELCFRREGQMDLCGEMSTLMENLERDEGMRDVDIWRRRWMLCFFLDGTRPLDCIVWRWRVNREIKNNLLGLDRVVGRLLFKTRQTVSCDKFVGRNSPWKVVQQHRHRRCCCRCCDVKRGCACARVLSSVFFCEAIVPDEECKNERSEHNKQAKKEKWATHTAEMATRLDPNPRHHPKQSVP